ncbi:hypothetical protein PUF88_04055 [Lactobacillaceae bacterium L1_55_11]|nr:hypothetical protein [Lactobacillaceae bacterium L1_55_11]
MFPSEYDKFKTYVDQMDSLSFKNFLFNKHNYPYAIFPVVGVIILALFGQRSWLSLITQFIILVVAVLSFEYLSYRSIKNLAAKNGKFSVRRNVWGLFAFDVLIVCTAFWGAFHHWTWLRFLILLITAGIVAFIVVVLMTAPALKENVERYQGGK